jgi:hypothetical protein
VLLDNKAHMVAFLDLSESGESAAKAEGSEATTRSEAARGESGEGTTVSEGGYFDIHFLMGDSQQHLFLP